MDCQTCQDRLIDQVLGEPLPDTDRVNTHLRECAACQAELAALNEAYHAIGMSLQPAAISPSLKAELFDRIEGRIESRPAPAVAGKIEPEPWISRAFKLFVASAVAAGVAVVLTHAFMMVRVRDLQARAEGLCQALQFSQQQNVAMQEEIKRNGAPMQVLQAADLRLVNLAPEPQSGGACRLFFDSHSATGYLVVRGAPPAPSGRTYELWVIDAAQKKTPAGVFDVAPDGSARMPVKLDPAAASGATLAAVTDEPPGGLPQPTGSIRFKGKIE